MTELISISEVAKELGCSYFTARNRLLANPKTKALGQKVGHAVCYNRSVLGVLRGESN